MDAARKAPIPALRESDIRLLRIFRVVAESGGVTAAEPRLHMERSTISRHVKALEEKLGGCLCVRGPAGFELTDLGHAALAAAIQAGDMLDRVRDELNRARNVLTGDLHVGLADNCLSNPACGIAQALARMAQEAPGVRIHLAVQPPGDLARELAARKLHLCIAGTIGQEQDLVRHKLFEEEFRLYTRTPRGSESLQLPDLVDEGYAIVTRKDEPHSERLAADLPGTRRSDARGLEAVALLLAGGRHVGFLPVHYAAMIAGSVPLSEVEGADHLAYGSEFFLNHERNRPLSDPGRLFCRIVLEASSAELRFDVPCRTGLGPPR